jgi:serine/threonine-protein kinase
LSYHSAIGRYELIGHLATGGMAEIHLARLAGEAGFEKIVVVKTLLPELVASKAFVAMFLEEAKLVARLNHPNVCEVYELGREGAEYFIVMPFLDGLPASALHCDARVAAGIVVQACAGLHHAHELPDADLVHRDVSPSNLFVTTAGVVKVLDFGVAKVRGATETEAGTIKGKTQYMAPEQLLGEPLDRRADIFALGIVLYELATGRRLFERSSDYLAARAILEEPIPRADAPRELADVIARALARDRNARYADAREFARAIEQAMSAHGGIASADEIAASLREAHGTELEAQRTRQHRVLDDARSRGDASQLATQPRPARPRRTRTLTLALAGGTAVALAGGVVLWSMSGARTPAVRPPDVAVRSPDAATNVLDASPGSAAAPTVEQPEETRPPEAHNRDKKLDAVVRPRGRGTFSIDSTPFATIFVDDHEVGITPLIHQPIAAGHHKVRAVLKDGRSRELDLDVAAGKAASAIRLGW